ncbi:unnamed protein product [Lupinus luteus]|uniref:CASP-like protein n=1 Tax=Lupinus luteus TaxID=3873 RepID=A0AAV1XZ55_LUPLU
MASGPVELASAGASIALFNQALKISVAPLVSITTSFVAEEDTKEKINTIAAEKQFNESVKAKSIEVTSNDHLPRDIKSENSETPTEAFAANGEKNDAFAVPQNVDKEGPLRSETNNGDGGLVLARIVAATFCVTLSASFAARLGPIEMAAFQTCLQVWLTSSLLADGLAVAGQVHTETFRYYYCDEPQMLNFLSFSLANTQSVGSRLSIS